MIWKPPTVRSETETDMSAEQNIHETIMKLAEMRGRDKTFCPSEAARAAAPEQWRTLMGKVRSAAFELREEGKIEIEQNGEKLSGDTFSGPIRLRLSEEKTS